MVAVIVLAAMLLGAACYTLRRYVMGDRLEQSALFAFAMGVALAVILASVGCKASPTAPEAHHTAEVVEAPMVPAPQHNNIPATFAGHPDGPLVYLCATQLRPYAIDGQRVMVEDHYLQYEPCPATLVP